MKEADVSDERPAQVPRARPLREEDAIDIWIARWLRVPRKTLIERYGCDPRRLYEIWEEARFAGSRDKALIVIGERYPSLIGRLDPGPHRRIPRTAHPDQLGLFEMASSRDHN